MFGNFTKEEKAEWDKVNGNKKGNTTNMTIKIILAIMLLVSFVNVFTTGNVVVSTTGILTIAIILCSALIISTIKNEASNIIETIKNKNN